MNSAPQGYIPTSSNSIHGPDPSANYTTTNTYTPYPPTPAAPPNPIDLMQIPLRLAAGKKKSNIARFHTQNNAPVDFQTMAPPIKMYRAPEVSEPEPAPPPKENPYFKKKPQYNEKKPVPKDAKAIPIHLEDNEGSHSYDGLLEGGQTSNYALLLFENGIFNVIPVADWYNFKPKRVYHTFSTEEAESMMNNRAERAKKVAEKHGHLQSIIKTEEGGGGDKEDAEFKTNEEEDPDRFAAFGRADSDEEKKKKQQGKQKSVKKEEGGDSDNGEEPDWEGVFDDDDNDDLFRGVDEEPDAAPREGEAEGDGEDKENLTEAGKEIRNILKRQKEDDLSEAGSEFGSDEDDEDDEDEDDFNLEEKLPFINHLKFNSNANAETKQEEGASKDAGEAKSSQQAETGGEKEKKKSPTGSKKKSRSKEKEVKEETSPKGEKANKSRPSKKAAGSAKRGAADSEIKSPPTSSKKPKLETPKAEAAPSKPAASPAKPAAGAGPAVTEEEMRRVLSQGKRLRTLDLVSHFKAALGDAKQKTKFTELTRKLCSIVEEGGVKYLLLKP